jgi:hypothetical protein
MNQSYQNKENISNKTVKINQIKFKPHNQSTSITIQKSITLHKSNQE